MFQTHRAFAQRRPQAGRTGLAQAPTEDDRGAMYNEIDPCRHHRRRRGPAWEQIATGVWIPSGLTDRERRIATLHAWADVLPPTAIFDSLTALELHGVWLPPLPSDAPLFVALPESTGRIRRPEVRAVRRRAPMPTVSVAALPVAPVSEAVLAAARDLGTVDLLVLVDSALHLGACTLAELHEVAARPRRGVPRLRHTLDRCDPRAESPWETLLRMLHQACDVPVEPQAEIRAPDGSFLARADLLITETRTLQEYDGVDHLGRRQYGRDRRRDSRLATAGYTRHGYVKEDVIAKPIGILRHADLALGRPHDPARIRAWHEQVKGSLFTDAGAASIRRRWGLPSAYVA